MPPLLLLEEFRQGFWPPPWDNPMGEAVLTTLAELHATAVALPPLAAVHPRVAQGWHEVAADPQPCLSLGLASSAWLDRSLPALVASTELVILAGAFLTHSTRGGSAMGCAGA